MLHQTLVVFLFCISISYAELGDQIVLVIHSGSRNLGKQIAEHYQNRAYDELMEMKVEKDTLIAQLKAEGRQK